MRVLCLLGEHQYGIPERGVGIEYAAFVPAFRRLGCNVAVFDIWRRGVYADLAEMNASLLATVASYQPDIVFSVQMGYEIWTETLSLIAASQGPATVCWTTDDSWKYEQVSRFLGHYYDGMTTTYGSIVPRYVHDGIPVLLTQWAARSEDLQDPLPASLCRYPVTFVGAAHGDRAKAVDSLRRAGVDVTCFGHGWPNGVIDSASMRSVFRESVISVGFTNARVGRQLKARTYEVCGAGGFLLTEEAPELERAYRIGSEIDTWASLGELVEKIRYYLSRPRARDAIAMAGHLRTRVEHTYDERTKAIIEFALRCKAKRHLRDGRRQHVPFEVARRRHSRGKLLVGAGACWRSACQLLLGADQGARAARRIAFELSWRLVGSATFSARGLPGRLYPWD